VFGSEIPIGNISGYLKAKGSEAFLIVDGCQAAGHLVRAETPLVDAYVISGHKMCGPTGVGATYISDRLKSVIGNFNLGGGVVDWFDKHGNFQLSPFPYNLEAGTPPIAEAVGLGVAAEFLDERRSAILVKEAELREYLISQVKRHLPGAEILSDSFPRVIPLVSLKFPDGMSAADIAVLISGRICVRAGVHCAGPLHAAVGADGGSLRLSLGFYNSKSEVDYAVRAIVENARAVQ
jgi:cysteine desulfurase/selenocysteine lyase